MTLPKKSVPINIEKIHKVYINKQMQKINLGIL